MPVDGRINRILSPHVIDAIQPQNLTVGHVYDDLPT
jgi:hypothetical protein